MKKKLLLSFAVFATALTVNAQKKFVENNEVSKPKPFSKELQEKTNVAGDQSYYYWENNSRVTKELNTFLGKTGYADGGFDTLILYSYEFKQKTSSATYWQMAIQGFPTADTLALNSVKFVGSSLNPNGANVVVNVYKKDLKTLLATKTLALTSTYGYKTVTFDSPVTDSDTMLVTFQMATVADSFEMAQSHNQWVGNTLGTPNKFTSSLPFKGDAALLAMQPSNSGILGLLRENFDFFVIPSFTYNFKAKFEASKTTINRTESVTFTKKNDSHFQNPILNYIKWDALANGSPFAYSTFNFGESADADFDTAVVSHQFDTKGVFKVKQKVFLVTWYLGDFLEDSSEVTITVNSALSLDVKKALNGLAIYPNPVANELNVSFNANSDATIELVNLAGQVIATKNASAFANVTFDTAELNAGVYFINIKVAEGTFTQKVIKD